MIQHCVYENIRYEAEYLGIKSVYVTSYWTSIVTLVLSCCVSEILELLHADSRFIDSPSLLRPKFQGVPHGVDLWCWGLLSTNTPG